MNPNIYNYSVLTKCNNNYTEFISREDPVDYHKTLLLTFYHASPRLLANIFLT